MNENDKVSNLNKSSKTTQNLIAKSSKYIKNIFSDLGTSESGLSPKEAAERLESHGPNEISYDQRKPWYYYFLKSFVDPFVFILAVIVAVSYFTDVAFAVKGDESWATVLIISLMIIISVLLKFFQEFKSQIEAEKLQDLVPTMATVQRSDGSKNEINMDDVVPGDIIHLAAGDLIPADLRIISCKDLFIS